MCYANDTALYGTADAPQINGANYDVHKAYIEPNQGYQSQSNSSAPVKAERVVIKTHEPAVNFKSDSWATDVKVEKMLKQAASDGKLDYVLNEAKKTNVPASVAVVPIVESNYNRKALSNKGAGGAWQLMPGTANEYGLSADGRFDFNSSTQAAIQLLNDLHQEFGNWALAFAAYNCGSQCVRNALRKNPNATDIDELSLPAETKNYVHKVVQLNQVIAGLDKSPGSNPKPTKNINN